MRFKRFKISLGLQSMHLFRKSEISEVDEKGELFSWLGHCGLLS